MFPMLRTGFMAGAISSGGDRIGAGWNAGSVYCVLVFFLFLTR